VRAKETGHNMTQGSQKGKHTVSSIRVDLTSAGSALDSARSGHNILLPRQSYMQQCENWYA